MYKLKFEQFLFIKKTTTFYPRGNIFSTSLFKIYTIVKIFKLMQIFSENAYSTCFIKRELSCFG